MKRLNSPNKRNWLKFLLFSAVIFFVFNLTVSSTTYDSLATTLSWNYANAQAAPTPLPGGDQGAYTPPNATGSNSSGVFETAFLWVINTILQAVWTVLSSLLVVAGILFEYAIDPSIILAVLNSPAIYTGWATVRDLVNLSFILILLFSAFCTVFQIDKYSIKRVLLNLVLMALLINFSFPVARFIVDAANVPMYFFIDNIKANNNGQSISARLARESGYEQIITPPEGESSPSGGALTQKLIINIIFTFILMITFLALGILLIFRVISLAILIIFAPFGFMPNVIGSYSGKWWSKLLQDAFFGPVVAFMIYFSYSLMTVMNSSDSNSVIKGIVSATQQHGRTVVPHWIASSIYFSIPIVLLWMAIAYAKSGSVAGSGVVMGKAEKFGKYVGSNWGGARPIWNSTGIPGGVKKGAGAWKKDFAASRERREAKMAGLVRKGPGGWSVAASEAERRRINEKLDELKKTASTAQLKTSLASGDKTSKIAAAMALNDKDSIDDIDTYKNAMTALSDERFEDLRGGIRSKAKKSNNMHLVLAHEMEAAGTSPAARTAAMQKVFGEMSLEKIGEQKGIHDDTFLTTNKEVATYLTSLNPAEKTEAMKKMPKKGRDAWVKNGIVSKT